MSDAAKKAKAATRTCKGCGQMGVMSEMTRIGPHSYVHKECEGKPLQFPIR